MTYALHRRISSHEPERCTERLTENEEESLPDVGKAPAIAARTRTELHLMGITIAGILEIRTFVAGACGLRMRKHPHGRSPTVSNTCCHLISSFTIRRRNSILSFALDMRVYQWCIIQVACCGMGIEKERPVVIDSLRCDCCKKALEKIDLSSIVPEGPKRLPVWLGKTSLIRLTVFLPLSAVVTGCKLLLIEFESARRKLNLTAFVRLKVSNHTRQPIRLESMSDNIINSSNFGLSANPDKQDAFTGQSMWHAGGSREPSILFSGIFEPGPGFHIRWQKNDLGSQKNYPEEQLASLEFHEINSGPRQEDAKQQSCPQSPEFSAYIDHLAGNIYDPSRLGDLKALKNRYNCEIQQTKDPARALRHYLANDDDPYTSMMDEAEHKAFWESLRGVSVDIGLRMRHPTAAEAEQATKTPFIVYDFMPASTASDAGIMRGDELLEIDGRSLLHKTRQDTLAMLEGPENSTVKIKVLRDGKELDFVVDRKKIEHPAVTVERLEKGRFVRIRVHDFMQRDTSDELAQAVRENPQAKGFILDLRHNPGGLLDQGAKAVSVFTNQGKLFSTRTRVPSDPAKPLYRENVYSVNPYEITRTDNDGVPMHYQTSHPDLTDVPLAVLIDQGTASASELVAGALKDSGGAYLIGTRSAGKGIGQTVDKDDRTGGAIEYTKFAYFTPSGKWVGDGHRKRYGLTPDKTVANPAPVDFGTAFDEQINAAVDHLKSKLPAKKTP